LKETRGAKKPLSEAIKKKISDSAKESKKWRDYLLDKAVENYKKKYEEE
jgi:hypothetical protein